jgi:hypothetical protein
MRWVSCAAALHSMSKNLPERKNEAHTQPPILVIWLTDYFRELGFI